MIISRGRSRTTRSSGNSEYAAWQIVAIVTIIAIALYAVTGGYDFPRGLIVSWIWMLIVLFRLVSEHIHPPETIYRYATYAMACGQILCHGDVLLRLGLNGQNLLIAALSTIVTAVSVSMMTFRVSRKRQGKRPRTI
jgi:hypothetical protein